MPPIQISSDPALLDLDAIYAFLSSCYWSPGIARSRLERAIAHSLCFAAYDTTTPRSPGSPFPALVGFARVVTDHATFAYLCDVFVLESHRGQGISKDLMGTILADPRLQGLRRFSLMTRDAQGLYSQFGFTNEPDPSRAMSRRDTELYKRD